MDSIRRRCSARATSSRCTLSVKTSNSAASSRIRSRVFLTSVSWPWRAVTTCSRSNAANETDWPSNSRPLSVAITTAFATCASRRRRSRNSIARALAVRSKLAVCSSCSAWVANARTRSSPVRTVKRAFISSWRVS